MSAEDRDTIISTPATDTGGSVSHFSRKVGDWPMIVLHEILTACVAGATQVRCRRALGRVLFRKDRTAGWGQFVRWQRSNYRFAQHHWANIRQRTFIRRHLTNWTSRRFVTWQVTVFQNRALVRHQPFFCSLRGCVGPDSASEDVRAPSASRFRGGGLRREKAVMRPLQFVTQCVTNWNSERTAFKIGICDAVRHKSKDSSSPESEG